MACYTFSLSVGQLMNTTPVKTSPFAAKQSSNHFSHLHTNQSAAQQVRDSSMQASGSRKDICVRDAPCWDQTLRTC